MLLSGRPIHPSAWKVHSANFASTGLSEVRQESLKDHPLGDAPLLAVLLHWVQPLRWGAWGRRRTR